MQNDDFLTLADAAKEVGLSPVTIRAYTLGTLLPKLPSRTIGRAKVVTRDDFETWKVQRQEKRDK